ncbi:DUF3313 family protein (plasmid) [Pseudoalteromonas espejiana]
MHPLGDYEKFIIDQFNRLLRPKRNKRYIPWRYSIITAVFFISHVRENTKAGYKVVTRSDKNTLRISFTLSNLKAPSSLLNASLLVLPGVTLSVGEVTIEGVFRDSLSNQINAVVYEGSQGSYLFKDKPWSTFSDIESAFDRWAEGFTDAVKRLIIHKFNALD